MTIQASRSTSVSLANQPSATAATGTVVLPYFHTPERIAALHAKLSEWRGTRWSHAGVRPNEMRCGVTGDCLFWVHVFKAIGALPPNIEIPEYRSQQALSDRMNTLRSRIEATHRAELVWCRGGNSMPPLIPGDLLLFHNGMSGAHCGLVVKERPVHFVHLSRNGFLAEPLNQSHWLDNLAFVYRLLEGELNVGSSTLSVERSGVSAP